MTKKFQVNNPPKQSPIVGVDDTSDSILGLFDENNPDRDLFNLIDDETIRLSGSKVYVYKYYQSEEFDDVYMESRKKAIAKDPVVLFAHYDPRPVEQNLTEFGIEIDNDQIFTFNKLYAERMLGRKIIEGDIIKPFFQNMKYKIYQVSEDSFEAYGVYHLVCYGKLLRDTEEIHNETMLDTTDKLGKTEIV